MSACIATKSGLVSARPKTVQPRTVARAGAPAMVPDMAKRVSERKRRGASDWGGGG